MNSVKEKNQRLKKRIRIFLMMLCLLFQISPARPMQAATARTLNPSVDTVLANVRNYMLSVDTNPDYSSIWNVIGMVRSGQTIPTSYINDFYNNMINQLEEHNWQLSRTKYSDYSKLILGLTAIGKDARDIDGHNMLSYLSDFSKVKIQGFNGPIWALIALNSHPDYDIPLDLGASEQTTEEGLIQYLITRETSKGGWTLYGDTPDTDITGMTIQALAPYYGQREDVTGAIDRALSWLSSAQNEEGGYSTLNGNSTAETSESDAQVIVALCSLGINPSTDNRFIRSNGKWVISRLFDYYIPESSNTAGVMHILSDSENNGGGVAGALNGMATEQGMYALAAYQRLLSGKTALYDMSDVTLSSGKAAEPSTAAAATKSGSGDTTTQDNRTSANSGKVKVTKLTLNYKKITLQKGKTRTLKLNITPSNASSKKVKWTSSDKKIATVTQKGKVKGIKAGKVNITATAQDGSKKKAVCKVIVKNPSSKSSSSGSDSGNSGKVKVKDVSLSFKQISVAVGASRTLTAVVTPTNASNRKLTWSSSSKSIATVSQSGTVTGKRSGTVTITAKAKDGSNSSASCTVIVYGATSGSSSSASSPSASSASSGYGNYGQSVSSAPQRESSLSSGTGQPGTAAGSAAGAGQPGSPGSGNVRGSAGNTASSDSNTQASTETGAWSFDGEAYVPESSGSSNGEADVWLADGAPFPEYDAGQESTADKTEREYTGYTEDLSEPEETEEGDLPPWLAVLLGLVVPGGLAGSFKVPWQTVGDKMLLLSSMRKKE